MANTYTDLLKLRMPALGDIGWDDEVNDNTEIFEFTIAPILKGNRIVSGLAPSDGGGLDIDVAGGTVVVDGNTYTLSADTKTCTASGKNYLYIDDSGTLQCTTTFPVGSFTAISIIDADVSSLIRFSDARILSQNMLAFTVSHSPENYIEDTTEDAEIDQHLAGIDNTLIHLSSFRNRIINGRFKHAQYGTSQTLSGYGSMDRWYNIHSGSSKTTTQEAFTIGQTDVPNNPKNYSRTVVTTDNGASSFVVQSQRLESVYTFAGQKALLEFYAKADSSKNIAVEFSQFFGTTGSPSSTIYSIDVTTFNLTTAWQHFTAEIDIPSISGKTLGSSNTDQLSLLFWLDAGSDYDSRTNSLGNQSGTFDIAEVQLRPYFTPWEYRPDWIEKQLCQRYAQLNPPMRGVMDASNSYFSCAISYWIEMRSAPTITLVDGTSKVVLHFSGFFNISSIYSATANYLEMILSSGLGSNSVGDVLQNAFLFKSEL